MGWLLNICEHIDFSEIWLSGLLIDWQYCPELQPFQVKSTFFILRFYYLAWQADSQIKQNFALWGTPGGRYSLYLGVFYVCIQYSQSRGGISEFAFICVHSKKSSSSLRLSAGQGNPRKDIWRTGSNINAPGQFLLFLCAAVSHCANTSRSATGSEGPKNVKNDEDAKFGDD